MIFLIEVSINTLTPYVRPQAELTKTCIRQPEQKNSGYIHMICSYGVYQGQTRYGKYFGI